MDDRDHFTLDEFRQRSGLSVVTLRRYIKAGHLPAIQPGGPGHRILIPRDALDRLLACRREQADSAPAQSSLGASKPTIPGPKPRWLTETP